MGNLKFVDLALSSFAAARRENRNQQVHSGQILDKFWTKKAFKFNHEVIPMDCKNEINRREFDLILIDFPFFSAVVRVLQLDDDETI